MTAADPMSDVARRLAAVERRIADACGRCGRDPAEVTLVAISKRHGLDRIRAAIDAGQRQFGENQVQEGTGKIEALAAHPAGGALRWHLVGPLQSNKVKAAVAAFDVLHAVDRVKIAHKVGAECRAQGRTLDVFVQVNVGGEDTKHGFAPATFERAARPLADIEGLRIVGLMVIPPYEDDPQDARRWFRQLRELRDQAAAWPSWQPTFRGWLSMGMSHDLEVAVEEGASHVRVGTDIFGSRPG